MSQIFHYRARHSIQRSLSIGVVVIATFVAFFVYRVDNVDDAVPYVVGALAGIAMILVQAYGLQRDARRLGTVSLSDDELSIEHSQGSASMRLADVVEAREDGPVLLLLSADGSSIIVGAVELNTGRADYSFQLDDEGAVRARVATVCTIAKAPTMPPSPGARVIAFGFTIVALLLSGLSWLASHLTPHSENLDLFIIPGLVFLLAVLYLIAGMRRSQAVAVPTWWFDTAHAKRIVLRFGALFLLCHVALLATQWW